MSCQLFHGPRNYLGGGAGSGGAINSTTPGAATGSSPDHKSSCQNIVRTRPYYLPALKGNKLRPSKKGLFESVASTAPKWFV